MGYDAITTGVATSIPAAAVQRDAGGKKKRANRSAKLKQYKLDARREQWLSQVKGKDNCREHSPVESPTSPSLLRRPNRQINFQASSRDDEPNDGPINCSIGDWDPQLHNPDSPGNRSGNSSPSHSLTSRRSFESSSPSVSDVEEEVLDDWEAMVDALSEDNIESDLCVCPVDPVASLDSSVGRTLDSNSVKTKPEPVQNAPRAWQPDDAARPRCLPSLSKQWSFPMNIDHRCGNFQQKGILSLPSSCPICCEDLDPTDTSFLPCSCGFHLSFLLQADS